jgi:type VI secretion system protein ImpE
MPLDRAEQQLKTGDLAGALAALQEAVRGNASNPKLRIFLFQLLCVMGDWKRAVAQLKICGEMAPSALPMAQTYREAIICEVYREKVFEGQKEPLVFGQPQEWVAHLIEALKLLAQGRPAEAAQLRDRAFEAAPAEPGVIDGEEFEWIADADMRLGPMFEAVVNGRYFWVPFAAVSRLDFDLPCDLRDCVWSPATLTLKNEGQVVALLPTRYAGTAGRGSDAQKLGRATDWQDLGAETFVGLGQRIWTTDRGDHPLMQVRALDLGAGDG